MQGVSRKSTAAARPVEVVRHRPGRAGVTVRIEAPSRWDALDLTRELRAWRWYLVSQSADSWDVCVDVPSRRRRYELELLAAVQAWADRRDVDSVVHLPDTDVPVHPSQCTDPG
jgi:hypothetical protein